MPRRTPTAGDPMSSLFLNRLSSASPPTPPTALKMPARDDVGACDSSLSSWRELKTDAAAALQSVLEVKSISKSALTLSNPVSVMATRSTVPGMKLERGAVDSYFPLRVLDASAAFGRNYASNATAEPVTPDARLLDAAIALSELKSGVGNSNVSMRTATKRDLQGGLQKEHCRCTKSKCLMLYCSCFRKQVLCTKDCLCTQCKNNVENDGERKLVTTRKLGNGCKCKKNNCLKKYCDCLRDGFYCSDSCACLLCLNVFKPDENKHDKQAAKSDVCGPEQRELSKTSNAVGGISARLDAQYDHGRLAQKPEYFGRDLPKTSNAVDGISAMIDEKYDHGKQAIQPEYFGRDFPKTPNAVGGISAMLAAQSSVVEQMAIFWQMDAPMPNIPSASSAFTVVHPQQ